MTVRIGCERCGRLLQCREELTGKRVRCPHCGEAQQVVSEDMLLSPRFTTPSKRRAIRDGRGFIGDADSGVQSRPSRRHRGGLVLTLGILSWTNFCCFTTGQSSSGVDALSVLAFRFSLFICGVVAWLIGNCDLRAIREGKMDRAGRGLTKAGMALGSVATILVGCWFLACLVVAVLLIWSSRPAH
jgi:hypothetical protein